MADRVRENANRLDVVHADCAGIDTGKRGHYVAVDPERFEEPVRNFGTVTDELERMAAHLKSCGVRVVAMEATGVYWIPPFEVLDRARFEVHLVGVDAELAADIQNRLRALNRNIAKDRTLGPQFRVGHSYVTPSSPLAADATRRWFEDVVETEIGPLLEEYWFDQPDAAKAARKKLLAGW